jgi:hypothetical protein
MVGTGRAGITVCCGRGSGVPGGGAGLAAGVPGLSGAESLAVGLATGGAGDLCGTAGACGVAAATGVAVWTGGATGAVPPTGGRSGGRTKMGGATGVAAVSEGSGADAGAPGGVAGSELAPTTGRRAEASEAAAAGAEIGTWPCRGGRMRGGLGGRAGETGESGERKSLPARPTSPPGRDVSEPCISGAPYTGTVLTGSNPKCFRIVLARSSSSELEWVFLSCTPSSGSASSSFPGLISSSRANSLIRIFIE